MKPININNILLIGLCSFGLSACSGFFDKDNTPTPTALANFTPEAKLQTVWTTSTGSGTGDDYLKLVPAVDDSAIFTADKNGKVTATDRATGKTLWQANTNVTVTGGPGAGDGIVVVGGRDGAIKALSQTDGRALWQTQTSSEVLASPTVKHGVTIVKSIDGKVMAYDSHDGHSIWNYQQVEPNMILRGSSAPQVNFNSAIIGFANGNLNKLSLRDGSLIWQKTIAIPEGGFAIQRMVDIDADPLIFENHLYAATYQGHIAALDLSSAQDIWTHDISSYTGIAADIRHVYITDAKSDVWGFDASNGNVDWRQTQLEARNITGPATIANYIVIGDAEGYLHVLSKQDGHFVARVRVNSSGIIATPVVINNVIYVLTMDGKLAAYALS